MSKKNQNINFKGLRLKIITKKGVRSYKIKKLPVYFGSERSENIIRIPDSLVEEEHGGIGFEDGRLYYHDVSETGSYVNNIKIKQKKIPLKPGNNQIKLGEAKINVENDYWVNENDSNNSNLKIIPIVSAFSGILIIVILVYLGLKIFSNQPVQITDFKLSPDTLSIYKPVRLSRIDFDESGIKLNPKSTKLIILFNNEDSISINHPDLSKGIFIQAPKNLIKEDQLYKKVRVTLKIRSKDLEVQNELSKSYLISNTEKYLSDGRFVLHLKINRKILNYDLKTKGPEIKKVMIDFGDKTKSTDQNGLKVYFQNGTYKLKATVYSENNKEYHFNTSIVVQ